MPIQQPSSSSSLEDKKNCLLISNVNADIPSKDIEKLFGAFGNISKCEIAADEFNTNTKLWVVEYIETAHAFTSWLSMNNLNLGNNCMYLLPMMW